jgi:hypothetical protein
MIYLLSELDVTGVAAEPVHVSGPLLPMADYLLLFVYIFALLCSHPMTCKAVAWAAWMA